MFAPQHTILRTAALLTCLLTAACSRNPATRKLEAFVPKQDEELALGQEAELQLGEAIRQYQDEKVLALVERVGARVAAVSERPALPWEFTVVDDPEPNAFAIPGGAIYVTRGLLAHLNSESELAAVLAHETAHVAARHGVKELRRLARRQHRRGASSLEGELRALSRLGSRAAARMLERSREQELIADEVGLRYLDRSGYESSSMGAVLKTLGALHGAPGQEQPGSHPTTLHRRAMIQLAQEDRVEGKADAAYLETIDGLVFGPDPRLGYYKDGSFVHPKLGFQLKLPKDWTVEYRRGNAVAKNPAANTFLLVGQSEAESVRAGMNEVFSGNVAKKNPWSGTIRGHDAAMAEFATTREGEPLYAFIGVIEFGGQLVQVVAFSPVPKWPAEEIRTVFKSFESAPASRRKVEPMRIELVELKKATTLHRDYARRPSSVPLSVIERINHAKADETLEAGRRIKRVRGFNPDFSYVRVNATGSDPKPQDGED